METNQIKLGLYSITYGGIWYDGPALSFEEFVRKAKEYGYDGVELDNKRPMGSPLDLDAARREEMRNILEREGMEVPCVAANNDFSSPVPEHRSCQLLMVKETARLAADLGAPVVRLFAAWTGVPIHRGVGTYDFTNGFYSFERQYPYSTWIERWEFVRSCLKEAAAYGEEFGVTMVLQNHHPLIRHWKDVVDMVAEVDSPWLKVCLDLPMLASYDHAWVEEAARTVGSLQTHSHFGGEFIRDEDGKAQLKPHCFGFAKPLPDYPHYIRLMREIGYEGFFTFELCHPVWDERHQAVKIDTVHEQAQLAREFMRDVIANT